VRDYELGIVVSPEASEDQTKAILDRVTQVAQTNGGQVVKLHPWGRRRLAYPIERHRDGIYFFLDLSLTPQTVLEIDRNLKVTEEVIRHLLVKRDPKAIAMQRAREAHAAATAEAPAGVVAQPGAVTQPEGVVAPAAVAVPEAVAEPAAVVAEADTPEADEAAEIDEADTDESEETVELGDVPDTEEEPEGEA